MPRPLQKWEEYRLLYCFPAGVSLVFLVLVREQGVHCLGVHFRQHLHKAGLVAQTVINLVDGSHLGIGVIGSKRTGKQHGDHGSGLFAQLIDGKTSLFHGRNCRPGEFQNVLLAVVGNRNFLSHRLKPPNFLTRIVHNDGRRGRNGNIQVNNFVDTATGGVASQLTIELELAVRAGGGQGLAVTGAAEPHSVALGLTVKGNQLLVVRQSVVRRKGQGIQGLNTGDVGLHIVRQGSGFQHFRVAAQVGKLLDVNELFVVSAYVLLFHQENTIGANCHV
nr:MAG TPA: hypothetical protein [Caudoviricetes sp.]